MFVPAALERSTGHMRLPVRLSERRLSRVRPMTAVMGAMETQAAAEAMAHDGVLPETLVILVEA
jgi:hypothetical protein